MVNLSYTESLIFVLLLIFSIPYILWMLTNKKDYLPLVVIQIIVGILLGPTIFGKLFPEEHQAIFNPNVIVTLNGIASWSIMLFVWIAGIELDINEAWKEKGETILVSSFALLIPFSLSSVFSSFLFHFIPGNWIGLQGNYWQVIFSIGISCSITALPILVLFLDNLQILRTNFGQRILRYASLDDIVVWGVLALILIDFEQIIKQLTFLFFFILSVFIVRKILYSANMENRWFISLIWLISCSFFSNWAGLHYMVGAFLSGFILDKQWFDSKTLDNFRDIILLIIMPIFFLSTGLRINWNIGNMNILYIGLLLLAISIFSKILAIKVVGKILRWPIEEIYIIGWLLQTKALIMIVFAKVLLDKEIITLDLFSALMVVAIFSTVLSMPMVRRYYVSS